MSDTVTRAFERNELYRLSGQVWLVARKGIDTGSEAFETLRGVARRRSADPDSFMAVAVPAGSCCGFGNKSVARSAHCARERGRRPASGGAAPDSPGPAPLLSRRRSGTVPAPPNLFAFRSHSVPDCACGGGAGLRPAPGAASSGSRPRWPRASSSRTEPRCRKPCRAGGGWRPAHACLRARATRPAPHRPPVAGANALAASVPRPDSLLRTCRLPQTGPHDAGMS